MSRLCIVVAILLTALPAAAQRPTYQGLTVTGPTVLGSASGVTQAPGDNSTALATTAFVQGALAAVPPGLNLLTPVRVVATANISLVAPGAIDGVTLATNDRVALIGQTVAAQNGIYIWNGTALVRAADAIPAASYFRVTAGATLAGSAWYLTNTGTITVGVTGLNFQQFSASALWPANNLADVASAAAARTNLGLGTMATQAANNVLITGGTAQLGSAYLTKSFPTTGAVSSSNSLLYGSAFIFGSSPSLSALNAHNYFALNDQINAANTVTGFRVDLAPGGGATAGPRTALLGQVGVGAAYNPGATGNQDAVGIAGSVYATVSQGGKPRGISPTTYRGSLFGIYGQAFLYTGQAYGGVIGTELDTAIDSTSSAANHWGLAIVNNNLHRTRGTYSDAGVVFTDQDPALSPGLRDLISIGTVSQPSSARADSTILRMPLRRYGLAGPAPTASTATMSRGIDFTETTIASGGFAFGSPNAAIDDKGAAFANGVTTTGAIAAQTASIASIAPAGAAGTYSVWPTLYIQAPPAGGTQAVAAVATMGGASILGFGTSGRNYSNGEIATAQGGTGTAPTFTVTTDGGGRVTALALASAGAWSSAPANPVRLVGGTSAQSSAYINVLSYTNTSGTFVPASWELAASGNGYAAGDVISVVGDTGTAARFTVNSVTPDGGILTATVSVVGSVTAIAGGTYHATSAVTGVGTSASILVGYTPLTVSVSNGGAGYPVKPVPWVLSSPTAYLMQEFAATMTPASAPLALTGSAITWNGSQVARVVSVPGSSTAACTPGDMAADASFIYVCRATNAWTRAANVGGW